MQSNALTRGRKTALVATGLVLGAVTAGAWPALAASSSTPSPSPTGSAGSGSGYGAGHSRGTETELTGELASKVKAAALAKVPGATVDRVETDADGAAYEAHLTKSDGTHVTVTFDKDINVVQVITGGPGGPGGHGHHGDAPAPSTTGSSTTTG